jgi:Icc-related predicted phosphoesterase
VRRRLSRRPSGERLFFATDLHGSDMCFRKFINAGRFYDVKYLVLGGDITGKTLVPIERTRRGWSARYLDHVYTDLTEAERLALEQAIRDHGHYPIVGERDDLLALQDTSVGDRAFVRAVIEGIGRWVSLAEQRLAGTDIRCFITPGNDDFWDIDQPLQESSVVEFVEGRCVPLDGHEMITTGYSNRTPWDSPRELDEAALRARLDEMCRHVHEPSNLVAVIHVPPYGTDLDQAPQIDEDLVVRTDAGSARIGPVGSTAVRAFIEEVQPLVALHGHVHESRGAQRIGRTVCINPGSQYTAGILDGAIVTLSDGAVVSYQLVSG